jgi:RNA polymerase sigma-70 factor, ECF subfamily
VALAGIDDAAMDLVALHLPLPTFSGSRGVSIPGASVPRAASAAQATVNPQAAVKPQAAVNQESDQRLVELVMTHGDFVTRSLRNLGVWGGELDDCVQKVFLVAARRLAEIEPGKERGFLFSCAQNTAAHFRRSLARKREVPDDDLLTHCAAGRSPEELVEQKRHRALLDVILESMDEGIRSPFVLHFFEEMTMAEIATVLGLPAGTVASRLRRARELFRSEFTRLQNPTPDKRGEDLS